MDRNPNHSDNSASAAPDPSLLFEMSVAYWKSCALFVALRLKLFDQLKTRPHTVGALGTALNIPKRSLSLLVKALAALDLVTIGDEHQIANTSLSAAFLCTGTPACLAESILFNARTYDAWGDLLTAVKSDRPAMDPGQLLGHDPEATRNFVLAMHHRAQGVARCLVHMLDLSGDDTMLDVGAGPCTYSLLLLDRFPDLKATAIDVPGVLAVADELVRASAARNRLRFQPGDVFELDSFGEGYDVVLLSGLLHRTEGKETLKLLRKCADALNPGGRIAISDLFTGGSTQGPILPELFALHMMLTSPMSSVPDIREMPDLLNQAGIEVETTIPYPSPLPHTLCLGRKLA